MSILCSGIKRPKSLPFALHLLAAYCLILRVCRPWQHSDKLISAYFCPGIKLQTYSLFGGTQIFLEQMLKLHTCTGGAPLERPVGERQWRTLDQVGCAKAWTPLMKPKHDVSRVDVGAEDSVPIAMHRQWRKNRSHEKIWLGSQGTEASSS